MSLDPRRLALVLSGAVMLGACSDALAPRHARDLRAPQRDVLTNPPDPNGLPPAISPLGFTVVAEATSPQGTPVPLPVLTAVDNAGNVIPVVCDNPGMFPLGTTQVACVATDANGLTSSTTVTVTVIDTTPPVLTVPASITVQATSPSGAPVSYVTTPAFDYGSGEVPVTCGPPSGSLFPVGTTVVQCVAVDASGNAATGSFTVTVLPFTSPIDVLVASLTSTINSLNISPLVKTRLLAYVAQLPTTLNGLTRIRRHWLFARCRPSSPPCRRSRRTCRWAPLHSSSRSQIRSSPR